MRSTMRVIAFCVAVFAFGTIAANAQINRSAEMDITFDFNVGEVSYKPGKYVIKVNQQSVTGATLTIQKVGSDESRTVLITREAADPFKNGLKLEFATVRGQRYLTGVATTTSGFAVSEHAKSDLRLAKSKKKEKPKTDL